MKEAVAYVDGGCEPNPGLGIFAAVVITPDASRDFMGGERESTNQRAEILAAILALEKVAWRGPTRIEIVSDSQYLVNCATGNWRRKKNQDLWQQLEKASEQHSVSYRWVRGHDGNPGNERAHELVAAVLSNRSRIEHGQSG